MSNRALKRSLSDFKRHPWLHFISVSTITIALCILGGFLICYRNFETVAEKTNPHVLGTVYLEEGTTPEAAQAIKEKILALPSVKQVNFKSKEDVVRELQSYLGRSGNQLPGADLFPDVIELEVPKEVSTSDMMLLKTRLAQMEGVTEVDFSEDWLAQYKKLRHMLKIFGLLLATAIVVGCSFIIANFMGMRHQSRKHEIDVVQLIGAHQHFVFAPFLWEALIEGILGVTAALGLLFAGKWMLSTFVSLQWSSLLGLHEWMYLSPLQIAVVLVMGIAMAFLGSFTVFLRFQE